MTERCAVKLKILQIKNSWMQKWNPEEKQDANKSESVGLYYDTCVMKEKERLAVRCTGFMRLQQLD